ncbi:site-specific tyrosine recombinase/integron integrase [Kordia antarctica]|uniref:site-specific tyrosine recombinase/integron integrase n=1 Tax=Kordia antarctica TaxID=1218801 RepID=UPI001D135BB2|nr:site-specific tyrosine recombinase/integron integrase [Kordia antarctica]
MKSTLGTTWSSSQKSWYIENNSENLAAISSVLKPHCIIDTKDLDKNHGSKKKVRVLSDEQKTILNNFFKFLKGKRYSKSTVQVYTYLVADFVAYHKSKSTDELTNRDVELFIEDIYVKRNYAISTQRQFISALKLFVVFQKNSSINNLELSRPKKTKKLPNILSQEEVLDLIRCTKNLKHRTIITLLYSCGLRVSEIINLKLSEIDIDRKQLVVRNAKGAKDRFVSLAESFLPLLSNYYYSYSPKIYFIEGKSNRKYSAESIRKFIKSNCKVAKITKNVTPHTLRHSYATHLLENGVDIRYIQTLLGHSRPETTMIYTHVQRKDLMAISNPLDVALQKIKESGNSNSKVLLSRNSN